jgi:hypothetical protein
MPKPIGRKVAIALIGGRTLALRWNAGLNQPLIARLPSTLV